MLIKLRKAQGATEYAIFIAAVLIGFIALQVYYQRAVKGNIKQRADSVGDQFTTTESFSSQSISQSNRVSDSGYIASAGESGAAGWSKSTITKDLGDSGLTDKASFRTGLAAAGAKLVTASGQDSGYAGAEYSTTDYVNATAGGGAIGSHGTMKSGKIAQSTPWKDAGVE